MFTRVHHVGLVVRRLEDGLALWRDRFGLRVSARGDGAGPGREGRAAADRPQRDRAARARSTRTAASPSSSRSAAKACTTSVPRDARRRRRSRRRARGRLPADRRGAAAGPRRHDLLPAPEGHARRADRVRDAAAGLAPSRPVRAGRARRPRAPRGDGAEPRSTRRGRRSTTRSSASRATRAAAAPGIVAAAVTVGGVRLCFVGERGRRPPAPTASGARRHRAAAAKASPGSCSSCRSIRRGQRASAAARARRGRRLRRSRAATACRSASRARGRDELVRAHRRDLSLPREGARRGSRSTGSPSRPARRARRPPLRDRAGRHALGRRARSQWLRKESFVMLHARRRRSARGARRVGIPRTGRSSCSRRPVATVRADLRTATGRSAASRTLDALLGARPDGGVRVVAAGPLSLTDIPQNGLSIINRASVDDFARRIGRDVHPLRFRANLYLAGVPAWAERDWIGRDGPASAHVDREDRRAHRALQRDARRPRDRDPRPRHRSAAARRTTATSSSASTPTSSGRRAPGRRSRRLGRGAVPSTGRDMPAPRRIRIRATPGCSRAPGCAAEPARQRARSDRKRRVAPSRRRGRSP